MTTTDAWQVVAEGTLEDAVRLRTVTVPEPAEGQARVAVAAASIGFPDMLLATGGYHDRPQLPFSLGGEAAGTVVATGAGTQVPIGSRVIVVPGQIATGLLQQELVVEAERLLPVPDEMSMLEAAALTSAYQTAYIGLTRRCHLQAGETLVVLGASGGVGTAALELGRALGARVIAVTRGAAKAQFCRDLGAEVVIDLAHQDLVAGIKEATHGRGADVIMDPVGGPLAEQACRAIAVEGRLLVVGFASGTVPALRANHALIKNYSIVGYRTWPFRGDPIYRSQVHSALVAFYLAGKIRPRVEEICFTDVPEGLRRLAEREVMGRLVINTSGER